ncbi:MAG TPA: hypothetical protein PKA55_20460 [Rhodoblastus sp.]|nr:hypothetical protein [Rhodoblastus sp.]
MKNITVSVDDETYRRARVRAAEMETSVSGLFKAYLKALVAGESEFERLKRLEEETRGKIVGFDPTDRLSRDELYERRR